MCFLFFTFVKVIFGARDIIFFFFVGLICLFFRKRITSNPFTSMRTELLYSLLRFLCFLPLSILSLIYEMRSRNGLNIVSYIYFFWRNFVLYTYKNLYCVRLFVMVTKVQKSKSFFLGTR